MYVGSGVRGRAVLVRNEFGSEGVVESVTAGSLVTGCTPICSFNYYSFLWWHGKDEPVTVSRGGFH